jgi:hypothetical protein
MKRKEYAIIVGNVGHVDTFTNKKQAITEFHVWVSESKQPYGRASGESVYLLRSGEPVCEYIGTMEVEQ